MKRSVNRFVRHVFPSVGRLQKERDSLASQLAQQAEAARANQEEHDRRAAQADEIEAFTERQPSVLKYRRAYFEINGVIAPGDGLPRARSWPDPIGYSSYRDKLVEHLPYRNGRGAEIGPLNLPFLSKSDANVLDTEGIRKKYPTLSDTVEVDRPMINDSIADTLANDAPLDYLVASHVMEHVPNPIRWMNEIASVLRAGGLLSIALPDRRATFDFYREETCASDLIAPYLRDLTIPDVRAVYDHHSQATAVNMHWAIPDESAYPHEVINGKGAVRPKVVSPDHMAMTRLAQSGQYLDVHCWVFTPPSFLLAMAQIAYDDLLPFRCKQFYPTVLTSGDRDNHSLIAILEKTDVPKEERRRSFLEALGPERQS